MQNLVQLFIETKQLPVFFDKVSLNKLKLEANWLSCTAAPDFKNVKILATFPHCMWLHIKGTHVHYSSDC